MSAPRPQLKAVFQTLGHTSALKDGTVRLPDFDLELEEVPEIIPVEEPELVPAGAVRADNAGDGGGAN